MAGSWRLAKSLEVLRDQVNALYPGRNKASDGTIGDAIHAASVSDHNPNAQGVVTAIDITHDPAHGFDIGQFAQALIGSRDTRIKYLVFNRLIVIPSSATEWGARSYTGNDPHTNHVHISVWGSYDDQTKWRIGMDDKLVDENYARSVFADYYGEDKPSKDQINSLVGRFWKSVINDARHSEQFAARKAYVTALEQENKALKSNNIDAKLDRIIKKLDA